MLQDNRFYLTKIRQCQSFVNTGENILLMLSAEYEDFTIPSKGLWQEDGVEDTVWTHTATSCVYITVSTLFCTWTSSRFRPKDLSPFLWFWLWVGIQKRNFLGGGRKEGVRFLFKKNKPTGFVGLQKSFHSVIWSLNISDTLQEHQMKE